MTKVLIAATLACMLASPVASQSTAPRPGYKDPGTSTLISVLIPGGGQLYSGDTRRGATLLGVGLGGLTLGVAMTAGSVGVSCNESDFSCKDDTNYAPMALGYAAYLGAWLYGIIDAGDSAGRMNAKHGITAALPEGVAPVVAVDPHGAARVGLNLRF
jgi:hypothetical protein